MLNGCALFRIGDRFVIALFVILLVFPAGIAAESPHHWLAVVQTRRTTVRSWSSDTSKEKKILEPDYSQSSWTTILCDGVKTQRLPGFFLSSGNALQKLEIKNETKKVVGTGGYFITTDTERLFMRQLGESTWHCLLDDEALADAKKTATDFLQECKDPQRHFMVPKSTAQFEVQFNIFPECVYHNFIGIRTYKATEFPVISSFHETESFSYDIKDGALSPLDEKALPKACLDRIQKQFNALSKSDQEMFGLFANKFAHYLIIPSPTGAKVDVFFTHNISRVYWGHIIHAGETDGLSPAEEAATLDFLHHHGQAVPKGKLSFASAAPDGKALIYANHGKLFWLAADGKPKQLANIDEARGIQWLCRETLTPAALVELK